MANIPLGYGNGIKTAGDVLRLPPGFCTRLENWFYHPDDNDRPHKIPGRSLSYDLLASDVIHDPIGLVYYAAPNDDDTLIVLSDNKLFETPAGLTTIEPTAVVDKQATPVAFPRTGSFLRATPDALKRIICWTGATSERPLVRDMDANWRFLCMKKCSKPTAVATTTVATPSFVDVSATPVTVDAGTVSSGFDNPTNVQDGDLATFASKAISTPKIIATNWYYNNAGTTTNQRVYIKFGVSSFSLEFEKGDREFPISEPANAVMVVRISTNAGATYTTLFSSSIPVNVQTIQYDLADGIAFNQIYVQVYYHYITGTIQTIPLVHDIRFQDQDAGAATPPDAGTYIYAVTEIYRVTLANGETLVAESAPSDTVSQTLDGATDTGTILTLGARANSLLEGFSTTLLKRRIWRSTKTGSFPDLGVIGEADIAATEFADTFDTPGANLGVPSLDMVVVDTIPYPAAAQCPAFYDTCLHDGALMSIFDFTFSWALRGFPEKWPFPQSYGFLALSKGEKAVGIESIGDNLLIFCRTRVIRFRNIPFASDTTFNIADLKSDILSPSEGLAGGPNGKALFNSQQGHAVCAWISDSGIWMTDGSLLSERGMGVVKLTAHVDWPRLVDTTRLDEATLTFDPVLQALVLDAPAPAPAHDGARRTYYLHTAAIHWVNSGADAAVPKVSGPHTLTAKARTLGVHDDHLLHWAVAADGKLVNERNGTSLLGRPFWSHAEGGWIYPSPDGVHIYDGCVYHSDWGAGEVCEVELLVRDDASGITQTVAKRGLSLRGETKTALGYIETAGDCVRASIRHNGFTTSLSTPVRAISPLELDAEEMEAA